MGNRPSSSESQDKSSPAPCSTPAREPFDDVSADIILRSSDNTDFYVHKSILSIASPVFRDMFSRAQRSTGTANQESASGPTIKQPVIPVTEPASTLDQMLRLIYPLVRSRHYSFDEVVTLLQASHKYQIEAISTQMEGSLLAFAEENPLGVYATACSVGLEDVAKMAAVFWGIKCQKFICSCGCRNPVHHCICRSGRCGHKRREEEEDELTRYCAKFEFSDTLAGITFMQGMESVTAGCYFRLLQYCRSGKSPYFFSRPPFHSQTDSEPDYAPYFQNHSDADLIIRSGDGVQFRVHKLLLSMASAHRILERCKEGTARRRLPVIYLDEPATTLGHLLRLLYPAFEEPEVTSIQHLAKVRAAGEKYDIPSAVSLMRRSMMNQVEKHPFPIYFLSKQYGWESDAEVAAVKCVQLESIDDIHVPEMETSLAEGYYDLLVAHFEAWTLKDSGTSDVRRLLM